MDAVDRLIEISELDGSSAPVARLLSVSFHRADCIRKLRAEQARELQAALDREPTCGICTRPYSKCRQANDLALPGDQHDFEPDAPLLERTGS